MSTAPGGPGKLPEQARQASLVVVGEDKGSPSRSTRHTIASTSSDDPLGGWKCS
jgi:hypothetical protein